MSIGIICQRRSVRQGKAVEAGQWDRLIDRDVARGVYRYAVTAQDSAAMPNESARSNEARVSVP